MNLTRPLSIHIFQIRTIPYFSAVPEIILMVLDPQKCDPAPTQQKNKHVAESAPQKLVRQS